LGPFTERAGTLIKLEERRIPSILHRMARMSARVGLAPFFRIDVLGRERIPCSGPFILLPKHQRWQDIPVLGLVLRRPAYYVAKVELFRHPLISSVLVALGGIPLNRQRPMESRASLRRIRQLIKAGETVVLFPEGTYFPDVLGPGHVGMLRYICQLGPVPLVPAGIRYLSGGGRICVRVHFGSPIYPQRCEPLPWLLQRLMAAIGSLSGMPSELVPAAGRM
jgi:1-acyl-sn-glycerol-3-phosphate acyltransferase